jgi:hypothetical protein
MANEKHVALLWQGIEGWNAWRDKHPYIEPDLREANLRKANLGRADLGRADLGRADLGDADLGDADLGDADLGHAHLREADLGGAHLREADLGGVNLGGAKLFETLFVNVNLTGATAAVLNAAESRLRRGGGWRCVELTGVYGRGFAPVDEV